MRDFITRGGAISVHHLAELHRAADDLAAGPAEGVSGDFADSATHVRAVTENAVSGPATQCHAGASEMMRFAPVPRVPEEIRP